MVWGVYAAGEAFFGCGVLLVWVSWVWAGFRGDVRFGYDMLVVVGDIPRVAL